MANEIKGIDAWIVQLGDTEAVALGNTIHELNEITAADDTSVNQLAGVILRDASLTSKVLRAANSVHYNPGGQPITTISRAIVQLGFATIRSICLTAIIMESLLKEHPRERLLEVLAHAFHCAIQARNLCKKLAPEAREEVFVAALLFNLGEMLVWASTHPAVDRLQAVYNETRDNKMVEERLGFSFQRLTKGLAEHWRLGEVLLEALNPGSKASRKAAAVILGDKLSEAMKQGMRSTEMEKVLKKVAAFTGDTDKRAKDQVLESLEEAAELTFSFGGSALSHLISGGEDDGSEDGTLEIEETHLEPNSRTQLQILQEITLMMAQKLDTNMLFQMVIEGLHRGVGLERVALAIFDQKRTQLNAKYILGEKTEEWRERFQFVYEKTPNNFFARLVENGGCCWIGHADYVELERMCPLALNAVVGRGEFLIAPVMVDKREIGVIYADIRVSGRAITGDYFNGFKHFVQTANLCLGVLAHRTTQSAG